jgi:glyceraldehyde-3-phosphate dehydrogenase (NAD(P)+) (phosphorylating)
VAVNGYGVIGKRVADAVRSQPDIELAGVPEPHISSHHDSQRRVHMKTKTYKTIPLVVAVTLFIVTGTLAQTEHHNSAQQSPSTTAKQQQEQMHRHDMSQTDMSSMMKEPHHILAMAYMQTVGTFSKALHDKVTGADSINPQFARAAVDEIKRSLDQAEQHHQEHMKTMSEEMRSHMGAMMKDMDMHWSKLKEAVAALESDVHSSSLNAKQVAAHTAEILKHLDEMSKMHGQDMKPKKAKM